MSDETVNDNAENAERVGFCQDCGKPLTRETVRTVGSGVFCEPCLETRLAGGAAVPPYGSVPAGAAAPPPPNAAGQVYSEPFPPVGGSSPSPVLAGFLGLIPGVGAMYNGQFAKGIAHIVIFALLDSMTHASGVFGILVCGWVFYQCFDAYHTAKARRDGMPLPDPFGLNNIGTHVGMHFQGTAAGVPTNPAGYGYAPPQTAATPQPETGQPWGSVPVPPASVYTQNPSYTASSPYTAPAPVWDSPAWTPPPAVPPAGQEWANTPGYSPVAPVDGVVPVRRSSVPTLAALLIGLGAIFMVFNFVPEWRFSIHKVFPFVLMAFAIWLFVRRMLLTGGISPAEDEGGAYANRAVFSLRWPLFLFTVSVLWMLAEFDMFRFGQTWPVLVIVVGVLMLLERSVGSRVVPGPVVDASAVNADGKGN
jgi:hypothetical protein